MFRSKLYININAICQNYQYLKTITKAEIAAVIKADSYGLGAIDIAPTLEKEKCTDFFVSWLEEGIALRKHIKGKIYVLHGVLPNEAALFIENDLIPVLNHLGQAEIWAFSAKNQYKELSCILHIDTGMHRLGMPEYEISQFVSKYSNSLHIEYIMSHLSCGEDINNTYNKEQLIKFEKLTKVLPQTKRSFANSSGIFLGKDYHFDLVRPGAALYGINPTLGSNMMKSVIELKSPIIQIQEVSKNSYVGYGATYQSNNPTKIATIPIGYADGYFRILSNNAFVYIAGIKAPVIGRVSMDLITIDVSNIPEHLLFIGQDVEIMGTNITIDMIAASANTNPYEVLTSLRNRYHRIYIRPQ